MNLSRVSDNAVSPASVVGTSTAGSKQAPACPLKILIVGGAGLIGGHAALRLKSRRHAVTIAGRNAPAAGTPLGELPFLALDYVRGEPPMERLSEFDVMVFAAGNDVRHVPEGADYFAHVSEANVVAQPRFFAAARAAGIKLAISIGSFYPHVAPHLLETNPYVRSRHLAWQATRDLRREDFRVVSIDPPAVMGAIPGHVSMYAAFVRYAEGRFAGLPLVVPAGGVNWVSVNSVSDCVESLLTKGENGRGYLIGDQNLSHKELFGAFFEALGMPVPPLSHEEHPILLDASLAWGRGNTLFFETDPEETAMLNYRRNDVLRTIREDVVPQFSGSEFRIDLGVL